MPSNCHNTADSFTASPGHWFEKSFCPCCRTECWAIFNGGASSIFFLPFPLNPEITSALSDFSNVSRTLNWYSEIWADTQNWEQSLAGRSGSWARRRNTILQLETYDDVLCHWGARWPEFGCHGFTFGYAVFLIFLAWFTFFLCKSTSTSKRKDSS